MSLSLTLKPRLSEKAYGLSQSNVFVFDVPANANKHTVARAVVAQFDVKVTNVNLANIKGKAKSTVYKKRRGPAGKQNDVRKAYVTLAKGSSLPFFAAVEEANAKEAEAAEKAAKAEAKANKKASKAAPDNKENK